MRSSVRMFYISAGITEKRYNRRALFRPTGKVRTIDCGHILLHGWIFVADRLWPVYLAGQLPQKTTPLYRKQVATKSW